MEIFKSDFNFVFKSKFKIQAENICLLNLALYSVITSSLTTLFIQLAILSIIIQQEQQGNSIQNCY